MRRRARLTQSASVKVKAGLTNGRWTECWPSLDPQHDMRSHQITGCTHLLITRAKSNRRKRLASGATKVAASDLKALYVKIGRWHWRMSFSEGALIRRRHAARNGMVVRDFDSPTRREAQLLSIAGALLPFRAKPVSGDHQKLMRRMAITVLYRMIHTSLNASS